MIRSFSTKSRKHITRSWLTDCSPLHLNTYAKVPYENSPSSINIVIICVDGVLYVDVPRANFQLQSLILACIDCQRLMLRMILKALGPRLQVFKQLQMNSFVVWATLLF